MKRRKGLTKIQRDEALLTSIKERLIGVSSLKNWCEWKEENINHYSERCQKMDCNKTQHLCYNPHIGYFYHVFCKHNGEGILWSPTDEQLAKFTKHIGDII